MSSSEHRFEARPWSPAPWAWDRIAGAYGSQNSGCLRQVLHPDDGQPDDRVLMATRYGVSGSEADTSLIALAPDMAEAILTHECGTSGHEVAGRDGCVNPICVVAAKLDAIR